MVPTLGTTNDGGVTSPAEAKIIVGGPRTRRGWGRQRGLQHLLINTDACFDACVSQSSSRTVRNRPVLGRVIRRADTAAAFTHTASLYGNGHSVLRCVASRSHKGIRGAMSPNRQLSGFFKEKLALLGRRACFIQYSEVLQTTAKKVVNFFAEKCFGTQLL